MVRILSGSVETRNPHQVCLVCFRRPLFVPDTSLRAHQKCLFLGTIFGKSQKIPLWSPTPHRGGHEIWQERYDNLGHRGFWFKIWWVKKFKMEIDWKNVGLPKLIRQPWKDTVLVTKVGLLQGQDYTIPSLCTLQVSHKLNPASLQQACLLWPRGLLFFIYSRSVTKGFMDGYRVNMHGKCNSHAWRSANGGVWVVSWYRYKQEPITCIVYQNFASS